VKVKTFKHPSTLGYLGELDVIYGDFFNLIFFLGDLAIKNSKKDSFFIIFEKMIYQLTKIQPPAPCPPSLKS